jgi:hypothetical protein
MKIKVIILVSLAVLVFGVVYQSCVSNDKTGSFSNNITPQPFPGIPTPGTTFPTDSTTIYGWLKNKDTISITKHAWSIWAGLTSNSNQVYNWMPSPLNKPDTLLIYQTWLGIYDIQQICSTGNKQGGCTNTKSTRERLDFPHQLTHGFRSTSAAIADTNAGFFVSVSYNPTAACFATNNLLLNQSTISSRVVPGGIGHIPSFPDSSIAIKPTYFIGKKSDKLIRIPAWQGPPANLSQVYSPQPPSQWNSYIYADVSNSQTPGKIAVPVGDIQTTPPNSAIVNLNEFIYYSLDSAAAAYVNNQQGANSVAAGDLAILVCMHVATKEISNWTWQTFFWTTNPAIPDFPSSAWQGALQPSSLNGAAAHYAVSTAYAMVWPNQPITGGTNTGVTSIFGYDPYLEPGLGAPFGNTNKLNPTYQYGLQSNCMSCHAMATTNGSITQLNGAPSLSYTADQYVDMNDPIFKNWVQLDFLWSIQGNLNPSKNIEIKKK